MLLKDFDFHLPKDLIAQTPLGERSGARLLLVEPEKGQYENLLVPNLSQFLESGDLLVLNNTKVILARLYGKKPTGGTVEVLVERIRSEREALVKIKARKSLRHGDRIFLEPPAELVVNRRTEDFYIVNCEGSLSMVEILHRFGRVPLPPYINRPANRNDVNRYQTVFAKQQGAVAAPTAGLHISKEFLEACKQKSVEIGYLTLHIGSGTYEPIRTLEVNEHHMHQEHMDLSRDLCDRINRVKINGGRVFAVGTTVLRALETVARSRGAIKPFRGETGLFIRPGFSFNLVDELFTNFHLPKSSLFVLVGAFAGLCRTHSAYQYAIKQRYRFCSYGDAMLVSKDRGILSCG